MLATFFVARFGARDSVGDHFAEAVRIVRASGLPTETNAMFTNVEGEWDEIMAVIRACSDKAAETAPRVTVTIKLDWRPGQSAGHLNRDLESVERRLR